jgi:hypothetical protein
VNAFLPVYTFAAYKIQGLGDQVHLDDYVRLVDGLEAWARSPEVARLGVHVKGVAMDVKRDLLLEAAVADSRWDFLNFFIYCPFL